MSFDRLLDLEHPCQPAVSPDGTRVAFTVEQAYTLPEVGRAARIWVAAADGSGADRVTDGPRSDRLPVWSPDGLMLAFVSDREQAKVGAIHLLDPDGSTRRLGQVAGSVEDLRWSSDGATVLALAADVGADQAGADSATPVGDVKEDPRVVRPASHWRRLWKIDVATGATAQLPLTGLNVWEFDWHGGDVAALVSEDPSESGWYDARVVRISGDEVTTVHTPRLQAASISLSPESGAIAMVESLASDRGVLYGDVTVVTATGEARVVEVGFDAAEVRWVDAATLVCTGMHHLDFAVATIALDGSVTPLWRGAADLGGHNFPLAVRDPHGRSLIAAHSSWEHPPELRSLPLDSPGSTWSELSRVNAAAAAIELPQRTAVSWTAPDGLELEGFLITPAETTQPPPLIVLVHGGPTAAYGAAYPRHFGSWQSAAGYALFLPNPRGSIGRGREFTEANLGDMGGRDLGDILSGIDALAERGLIDETRVGIMGGSYGGFMAAWAVTQTDRFGAAVAIAAVTDWLSFHNTTNIARFDELFLQADPYAPDGEYFRRSPVVHVRDVKTPTLVMHGELDLCVPLAQGQEFYSGLAAEDVTTELVIYPREGHGWDERDHQIDAVERMRDWFDRHLR
jgi:dipeptidyl aminopeptidase/acylaminoacyl peptidase